jgi:hypothetical protein
MCRRLESVKSDRTAMNYPSTEHVTCYMPERQTKSPLPKPDTTLHPRTSRYAQRPVVLQPFLCQPRLLVLDRLASSRLLPDGCEIPS